MRIGSFHSLLNMYDLNNAHTIECHSDAQACYEDDPIASFSCMKGPVLLRRKEDLPQARQESARAVGMASSGSARLRVMSGELQSHFGRAVPERPSQSESLFQ